MENGGGNGEGESKENGGRNDEKDGGGMVEEW